MSILCSLEIGLYYSSDLSGQHYLAGHGFVYMDQTPQGSLELSRQYIISMNLTVLEGSLDRDRLYMEWRGRHRCVDVVGIFDHLFEYCDVV